MTLTKAERQAKYYATHREEINARRRTGKRPRLQPETSMGRHVKSRYGLSMEEYEKLLSKGCTICGTHEGLQLDHDHETGKIRGPLCFRHNAGLGLFEDNSHDLEIAAEYVRGNGKLSKIPHGIRHSLLRWQFWAGMTLGFPLEHYLWVKIWPFEAITRWLGL